VICPAAADCHLPGVCQPGTGGCVYPPTDDGAACDDGDVCTRSESCLSGVCQGGSPSDCDDLEPCTADSCEPGIGCVHTPVSCNVCGDGFCDGPFEDALTCCTDCGCPQGDCVDNVCPCRCVTPGDCLVQTTCASTVNCNANGFCAP
jgi:hypothetical protein